MSLRPRISRLVLIAALVLAACVPFFASATALADASASVSPGGGDMRTAFTMAAQGLPPGDSVLIVLYDGAGNRYTYQQNGVDQAVVVDDNGNASLTVTPASDLPGSVPGTWTVVFTEEQTGSTATIQFDVTA